MKVTSRRNRRENGLSLIEVVITVVILGASLVPLISLQKISRRESRSNQRLHLAEGLAREAIDYLFERREDPTYGFAWIWNNASPPAPATTPPWTLHMSGFSNPGGSMSVVAPFAFINPPLDIKFQGSGLDPMSDPFDREVRLVRKSTNVAGNTVMYVEVRVRIYNVQEVRLTPPGAGSQAAYELVSYLGNGPPLAL